MSRKKKDKAYDPFGDARKLLEEFRAANPVLTFIEIPQGMSYTEARLRLVTDLFKSEGYR